MRNPGFRVAFFLADPQALQSLTGHDWLGLIHPVLMILFVYPVVGATIRLGILARESDSRSTQSPTRFRWSMRSMGLG